MILGESEIDYLPAACLDRAKQEISKNTTVHNRYACLELRQCIEALAYKKIHAYRSRIPIEAYKKWQPLNILKVLRALEENTEVDKYFKFYEENEKGALGKELFSFEQKELTVSFINKHYHKLSSNLHVPFKEEYPKSNLRIYLIELTTQLEAFVNAKSYCTVSNIITFNCSCCDKPIARNSLNVEENTKVQCFNAQCGAQYTANKRDDDKFEFKLDKAIIGCVCGEEIQIPTHALKEGLHKTCPQCTQKYYIAKPWSFTEMT
jgi:hypothetical protein|tara:strand:+ start:821 stop:1609 length:789 start_codon:yes stop_codon:yes gene_type:complete